MVDQSGFFIRRDTITPFLAVAAISSRQGWEDTILDVGVEALAWAKANAPWDDRTGAARAGLDVDVDSSRNDITLTLFHTVDYGEWLETRWSGRYAIIMPTLEKFGPEIKRRLEG